MQMNWGAREAVKKFESTSEFEEFNELQVVGYYEDCKMGVSTRHVSHPNLMLIAASFIAMERNSLALELLLCHWEARQS